jgi:DNA gyrase inhibitor GyrI
MEQEVKVRKQNAWVLVGIINHLELLQGIDMQLGLAIDNPKTTIAAKLQGYFCFFISYLTPLKTHNEVRGRFLLYF